MNTILQKNIIKDLGLENLSEKEQEESLLSIGRIIFQSVLIRVMEELDEAGKDEFEKILTEKPNDEEAILGFLQAKISNFNEIVSGEVAKFKQGSVDFMDKIKA
ncbi:MAG: DUF5663 domain-containing protein [Patescibacteria group bacterium]